jgi:putative transposase
MTLLLPQKIGKPSMKKSKYSESQIIKILNEDEFGIPVTDIGRENGICRAAYFKWKPKCEGLTPSITL